MMVEFTEDLYFQTQYTDLYRRKRDEVFQFEFKSQGFSFKTLSLKREIPGELSPTSERFFDLETAYGFGGYLTNTEDKAFLTQAFKEYSNYCRSQNIIAEFIRFHPYNTFPAKHSEYLQFVAKERQTVYLDLRLSKEDQWKLYSPTTRNLLRRCESQLSFQSTQDVDSFFQLYKTTMTRNKAQEFYYFEKSYFDQLILNPDVELFEVRLGDQLLSMGFFILGEEICYYHLSGNTEDSLKLNGNYFLLEKVREHAKSLGQKILFLGGGRTSSPEDSLFRFKKKFSPHLLDFYIGGVIHDQEIYKTHLDLFNDRFPDKLQVKMFLKYRMEL